MLLLLVVPGGSHVTAAAGGSALSPASSLSRPQVRDQTPCVVVLPIAVRRFERQGNPNPCTDEGSATTRPCCGMLTPLTRYPLKHDWVSCRLDMQEDEILPPAFEAEERSWPGCGDVLQLVSGRTLLGRVRELDHLRLPGTC